MEKTKKFFKDAAFYSASNFASNILKFIAGIVVRRVLQPALMGVFNQIMLVFDYARYSHLGIIDAMDRELPYFYGKGDQQRLERIRDVGFSTCIIVIFVISLGIFASSFFINAKEGLLLGGIRLVCLMIILRLINSLYIVLNRSRNRFSAISKYTLITSALDVGLKIFLVIKFGIYGLLWASVFTLIAGLFYFYKVSGEKFRFLLKFSFSEVTSLFKVGFPIFIMYFISMTLRSMDRIMIIRLLDTEKLGFYTIALMVSVYMLQLPNLIYAVFFPRFYQTYGAKQNISAIKGLFMKPTVIFAYFYPIAVGLIIFGLPLLLKYVLPAYASGFLPAAILLLGSFFIALTNMPEYLLIALNKQVYMVLFGVFSIAIGVGLNHFLVARMQLGLFGIAISSSAAYFCYTTILMIFAFRNYAKDISSHLKLFAQLYFPLLWVIALLVIMEGFAFGASGTLAEGCMEFGRKSVVFLLACAPLVFYANRKTAILTMARDTFLRKA